MIIGNTTYNRRQGAEVKCVFKKKNRALYKMCYEKVVFIIYIDIIIIEQMNTNRQQFL